MFEIRTSTHKALLALLCAFVLLVQAGAAAHAVWHAAHAAGHEDAVLAENHRGGSDESDVSMLCVFDAAFGQVLGGAPISSSSFSVQSVARAIAPHVGYGVATAQRFAPHSRGPPALL